MEELRCKIENLMRENEGMYYHIINNYLSIDELEERLQLNQTVAYYNYINLNVEEEELEYLYEELCIDYSGLESLIDELA